MQWAKFFRELKPQAAVIVIVLLMVAGFSWWPTPAAVPPPLPVVEAVAASTPPAPVPTLPNCEAIKCIALTFDDGPDASITPRVLDILKQHKAKATFFVLGSHIGGNEALLRRMHQEGHEIGNHSWSHASFTSLTPEQVQIEIFSTQAAITKAGVPAPNLFRPPYGNMNEVVMAYIPLSVVRWNIDPEDWRPKKQPYLLDHMAAYARPGSVVVMHDTEVTTADKLDSLLAQLEGQQYTFVTVSEVLGLSPGQRGLYYAR